MATTQTALVKIEESFNGPGRSHVYTIVSERGNQLKPKHNGGWVCGLPLDQVVKEDLGHGAMLKVTVEVIRKGRHKEDPRPFWRGKGSS